MCRDQFWILQVTELESSVQRPAQCLQLMHLSIITFLAGSTPPRKGKAISISFLHSKLWNPRAQFKRKSQWIRDAYKNTRCSFQIRGIVGLHSFLLQNAIQKRTESSSCYATGFNRSKYIACFGSQSSGFLSFSPIAPGSFLGETRES